MSVVGNCGEKGIILLTGADQDRARLAFSSVGYLGTKGGT